MGYASIQDVVEQVVLPYLGDHAADFDAVAIAREAYIYRVDTDPDGRELLNTAGFYPLVGPEVFGTIVAKHERTPANE